MKSRSSGPQDGSLCRAAHAASIACAISLTSFVAQASSGFDSPENGIEQMGRGSAWVARADDPLATYYNPAALAFQPNGVHVGSTIMFISRCYARLGVDGKPVSPGAGLPGPGAPGGPTSPVCSDGAGPNPQVALALRLSSRFAMGFAIVAPHAVGGNTWPVTIPYKNAFGVESQQPAPQRFMIISSNSIIVEPTLSFAYAPRDDLSFGAGFIWGIASSDFVNFAEALSPAPAKGTTPSDEFFSHGDTRAELKVKDLFIPGFVLGALWMPAPNVDVGGFYKYMSGLDAQADLNLQSLYFTSTGAVNTDPCMGRKPGCNITNAPGAGHLSFNLPMEARIGTRIHVPRAPGGDHPSWATQEGRKVRDPLSQDRFDVEVDVTWAHNSAVDAFNLRFPAGANAVPVKGTPGSVVPVNGDIVRNWKDVLGVRLGGDVVIIPNRLALRAGGWFETKGQDDKDLQLDFDLAQKAGLSGGSTLRVGPVDLSVAYQHTFIGTLDNGGQGDIHGLSGDASAHYRTLQPINGGSLAESMNEFGLSGTIRF